MKFIEQFKKRQPMSFADYMQMALYDAELGYYSSNQEKLGQAGDFITAPEMGPWFAYALANQYLEVLKTLGQGSILEFGAGTGRLCVDSLKRLDLLGAVPEHYYILELSANLKARQQQLVQDNIPHLAERVIWLNQWPETAFQGIMVANEVLDAMPVERFMLTEEGLMESFISLNKSGELKESFQICKQEALIEYLAHALPKDLPRPYLSEANLFIKPWLKSCYECLDKGLLLLVDYGFPRHEYYHPERNQGTVMCHIEQHAHSDFLARPGQQDITSHVDFTHVAEAGFDAGFQVAGYTSQAAFLMANGILDFGAAIDNERQHLAYNHAMKQLLQANEMGELFKIIALTKAYEKPLQGFALQDKRVSL